MCERSSVAGNFLGVPCRQINLPDALEWQRLTLGQIDRRCSVVIVIPSAARDLQLIDCRSLASLGMTMG